MFSSLLLEKEEKNGERRLRPARFTAGKNSGSVLLPVLVKLGRVSAKCPQRPVSVKWGRGRAEGSLVARFDQIGAELSPPPPGGKFWSIWAWAKLSAPWW